MTSTISYNSLDSKIPYSSKRSVTFQMDLDEDSIERRCENSFSKKKVPINGKESDDDHLVIKNILHLNDENKLSSQKYCLKGTPIFPRKLSHDPQQSIDNISELIHTNQHNPIKMCNRSSRNQEFHKYLDYFQSQKGTNITASSGGMVNKSADSITRNKKAVFRSGHNYSTSNDGKKDSSMRNRVDDKMMTGIINVRDDTNSNFNERSSGIEKDCPGNDTIHTGSNSSSSRGYFSSYSSINSRNDNNNNNLYPPPSQDTLRQIQNSSYSPSDNLERNNRLGFRKENLNSRTVMVPNSHLSTSSSMNRPASFNTIRGRLLENDWNKCYNKMNVSPTRDFDPQGERNLNYGRKYCLGYNGEDEEDGTIGAYVHSRVLKSYNNLDENSENFENEQQFEPNKYNLYESAGYGQTRRNNNIYKKEFVDTDQASFDYEMVVDEEEDGDIIYDEYIPNTPYYNNKSPIPHMSRRLYGRDKKNANLISMESKYHTKYQNDKNYNEQFSRSKCDYRRNQYINRNRAKSPPPQLKHYNQRSLQEYPMNVGMRLITKSKSDNYLLDDDQEDYYIHNNAPNSELLNGGEILQQRSANQKRIFRKNSSLNSFTHNSGRGDLKNYLHPGIRLLNCQPGLQQLPRRRQSHSDIMNIQEDDEECLSLVQRRRQIIDPSSRCFSSTDEPKLYLTKTYKNDRKNINELSILNSLNRKDSLFDVIHETIMGIYYPSITLVKDLEFPQYNSDLIPMKPVKPEWMSLPQEIVDKGEKLIKFLNSISDSHDMSQKLECPQRTYSTSQNQHISNHKETSLTHDQMRGSTLNLANAAKYYDNASDYDISQHKYDTTSDGGRYIRNFRNKRRCEDDDLRRELLNEYEEGNVPNHPPNDERKEFQNNTNVQRNSWNNLHRIENISNQQTDPIELPDSHYLNSQKLRYYLNDTMISNGDSTKSCDHNISPHRFNNKPCVPQKPVNISKLIDSSTINKSSKNAEKIISIFNKESSLDQYSTDLNED